MPNLLFSALEPQRNTIETQHYQTRDPQVFAAGDIVEGDKTVVYAVKTGKEAAGAIHHYLEELAHVNERSFDYFLRREVSQPVLPFFFAGRQLL